MSGRKLVLVAIVLAMVAPSSARPAAPTRADAETAPAYAFRQAVASGKMTGKEFIERRIALLAAPVSLGGSGLHLAQGSGTWDPDNEVLPVAAQDIDGDGLDEILTVQLPVACRLQECVRMLLGEYKGTLSMRRTDGTVLWTRPTTNFVGARFEDFDGDGRVELLVQEDRLIAVGAIYAALYKLRQTTSLVRADGTTIWSHRIDGEATIAIAGLFAYGLVVGFRSIEIRATPMPDADGDGRPDVFIATISAGAAYVVSIATAAGVIPMRLTTRTLRGTDGDVFSEAHQLGIATVACVLVCVLSPGFADAVPIADVSGDGKAEIVSTRFVAGVSTVEMRSVDASTVHWRSQLSADDHYLAVLQLDGSGPDDVFLSSPSSSTALRGQDGTELWSSQDVTLDRLTHAPPVAAGDIDADGGTDFVVPGPCCNESLFVAVSGASGSTIWTAVVEPSPPPDPNGRAFVSRCYSCPAVDLSGDGILDVMLDDYENGTEVTFDTRRGSIAVSGADGSVLWRSERSSDWNARLVVTQGDVNGNGSVDLTRFRPVEDGVLSFEILDGADLSPLWDLNAAVALESGWLNVMLGAELDGGPGEELLIAVFGFCAEGCGFKTATFAVDSSGILWSA